MILATWNETTSDDATSYCDKWRSAFEIRLTRRIFSIGITEQFHPRNHVWRTSHSGGFEMSIHGHFSFGRYHQWYDGEHCMFSLGFLHFTWAKRGCKKCAPDYACPV